jgi:SSS family solute:Na+ symporter/sodium/proline symporter
MGCPDAVRAGLLRVEGVLEVTYHTEQELFTVRFESVLTNLETIFAAVLTAGKQMGQEYLPEVGPSLASPFGSSKNALMLVSLILLTSLGTWGLPQMVHKFYAIKDKKAISRGTVISTLFALLIGGSAYFIGTFGRLFLSETPNNMDMVMPQVMTAALPSALLGIILVLLLSASMSTLSSLVLVSSSSISMDLIKGVIKP